MEKGVTQGRTDLAKRYGMVIDLKRCIGCDACTIACRQVHGTPMGLLFAKVIKRELGTYPDARSAFLPLLCMHCGQPLCADVCPTGATFKRDDGIVTIDPEQCIGCRNCVLACPYGARDSFQVRRTYYTEGKTAFEVAHDAKHLGGKVEKCDFCLDRLERGKEPACVAACPAEARIFGDLNDKKSRVSHILSIRRGHRLREDLETDPSVYYVL